MSDERNAADWARLTELIEAGGEQALVAAVEGDGGLLRARGESGESGVMAALYRGRRDLAHVLARAKKGVDLFEMVGLGVVAGIEGLFEVTGDSASVVKAISPDGFTVLQLSCYTAQAPVTELLLANGAELEAVASNGSQLRAIHAAVAGGEISCLRQVVEAGALVDAAQRGGVTALHAAAHRGHIPMVELLLDAGCNVNQSTRDGRDAREFGAQHPEVLALL